MSDEAVTEPAPPMPPEPSLADVMAAIQSVQAMQARTFEAVKDVASDQLAVRLNTERAVNDLGERMHKLERIVHQHTGNGAAE